MKPTLLTGPSPELIRKVSKLTEFVRELCEHDTAVAFEVMGAVLNALAVAMLTERYFSGDGYDRLPFIVHGELNMGQTMLTAQLHVDLEPVPEKRGAKGVN